MHVCGVIDENDDVASETDGIVLQQFTGIYDKNGKGVYEGDIFDTQHYRGEIVYSVDIGAFFVNKDEERYFLGALALQGEVIGNIYENRELLEVESA